MTNPVDNSLPDQNLIVRSLNDLLAEALAAALQDQQNLGAYRALVRRYPLPAMHVAFREALHAPARQIKKSRGAYFTYLCKVLSGQGNNTLSSTGPEAPLHFQHLETEEEIR